MRQEDLFLPASWDCDLLPGPLALLLRPHVLSHPDRMEISPENFVVQRRQIGQNDDFGLEKLGLSLADGILFQRRRHAVARLRPQQTRHGTTNDVQPLLDTISGGMKRQKKELHSV